MPIHILQIDTSTPVCSVALSRDGRTIGNLCEDDKQVHASRLTLMIAELMAANQLEYTDLSALAIAKGPGSYTGLRIGVSTAKGICYAADLPMIAIDSLRMLAEGYQLREQDRVPPDTLFCPMIDARRMEVYQAVYSSRMELLQPTSAVIIDENSYEFLLPHQQIHLFGSGADKFETLFTGNPQVKVLPGVKADAAMISTFAYQAFQHQDFVNLAYFEPYYLKDYIPTTPKK